MTSLDANPDSPAEFLNAAYRQLEFDQGALISAANAPQQETIEEWVDRGDWQQLAAQVGAESIFFVNHDPVVIFAKTIDLEPSAIRNLYERIWCMARPQLLFLATPGQLSAFDLTKPPPRHTEELTARNRLLAVANSVAEVQTTLAAYHRERIETGAVFGEERFRNSLSRSDRALIRDLKTVRHQLAEITTKAPQPKLCHLHSLIGRAIFIRYLEDREILTPEYFARVAMQHTGWQRILEEIPTRPALDPRFIDLCFPRVLKDKEFTYALFEQLATDFNGDIFPIDDTERDTIHQMHLDRLRGFLTGSTSDQINLFFFAYRFDVIPIELISTIYEEFYNERVDKYRNRGSHYTPPSLVEYVLAQTLTPSVLAARPRVIDPACGSGIFLVESFRRMVRHLRAQQNGRRVSRPQLRKLLRDQISGIDINEEAVRVAAFSLYLAFLHYQEPREINDERRLPYLKWVTDDERRRRERSLPGAQFYDVLLHANSFEVVDEKILPQAAKRFGEGCATVVVGNPPWGSPKKNDPEARRAMQAVEAWCNARRGRPIGDRELSQAFLHLTNALLKEGGAAGLLVSSGVLFKRHKNSRKFREVWLRSVRLKSVVNFGHVRHVFFSGFQRTASGVSPFISLVLEKSANLQTDNHFQYWSAKRTAVVENVGSVVLNRGDMHWLSQQDCLEYEKLWKIYWWGGHRDVALLRSMDRFPPLRDLPKNSAGLQLCSGRGFEVAGRTLPAGWLKRYRALPSSSFRSYGPISDDSLVPAPSNVYRRGFEDIYHGRRLLVARGIRTGGHITARFETKTYCFRNSIHGIRFEGLEQWQEAVITAIFWSSLARYYYFMTSGSWGLWHDEIHLDGVKEMPIQFPTDPQLRNRIVGLVHRLQNLTPTQSGLLFEETTSEYQDDEIMQELDAAIYDLYELGAAERDLIHELCSVGLDLFYRNQDSEAVAEVSRPKPAIGTFSDVENSSDDLSDYIFTFLKSWRSELDTEDDLVWRIISPPSRAPLLAISFAIGGKNGRSPTNGEDQKEWCDVLARLAQSSRTPSGSSRILVDTYYRYVGEQGLLFVKRNERRFWTRSAAREDVESTIAFLLNR